MPPQGLNTLDIPGRPKPPWAMRQSNYTKRRDNDKVGSIDLDCNVQSGARRGGGIPPPSWHQHRSRGVLYGVGNHHTQATTDHMKRKMVLSLSGLSYNRKQWVVKKCRRSLHSPRNATASRSCCNDPAAEANDDIVDRLVEQRNRPTYSEYWLPNIYSKPSVLY